MPSNEIMSVEGQLVGMPLAGPESFSQQQLVYLKRALGVDETVLWDGNGTALSSATLDESIYNFESVRIDLFMGASNIQSKYVRVDNAPTYISTGGITTEASTYVTYVFACSINISNSGKSLTVPQKGNGFAVLTNGSISYFQNNNIGTVRRIIGIHRIQGGN